MLPLLFLLLLLLFLFCNSSQDFKSAAVFYLTCYWWLIRAGVRVQTTGREWLGWAGQHIGLHHYRPLKLTTVWVILFSTFILYACFIEWMQGVWDLSVYVVTSSLIVLGLGRLWRFKFLSCSKWSTNNNHTVCVWPGLSYWGPVTRYLLPGSILRQRRQKYTGALFQQLDLSLTRCKM